MSDYGTLTDYTTGEEIRPATRDEWSKSIRADGRAVFVAGGPEIDDSELARIILDDGDGTEEWARVMLLRRRSDLAELFDRMTERQTAEWNTAMDGDDWFSATSDLLSNPDPTPARDAADAYYGRLRELAGEAR